MIKQLTAGDIHSDSVQSLDSLERVEQARILAQGRSEVTETFMAQYEQKERDRLLLFDAPVSQSMQQLYRPVRGAIMQSARPDLHIYATSIATAKNESVLAMMRGRIVHTERAADNSFTLVLQQTQYLTVYRGVTKALKPKGASVEAGEAIGVMDGDRNIEIELWDNGKFVNIEEVIAW
jgi:septal ring factor EnvC (AmiA/AmiB activator)